MGLVVVHIAQLHEPLLNVYDLGVVHAFGVHKRRGRGHGRGCGRGGCGQRRIIIALQIHHCVRRTLRALCVLCALRTSCILRRSRYDAPLASIDQNAERSHKNHARQNSAAGNDCLSFARRMFSAVRPNRPITPPRRTKRRMPSDALRKRFWKIKFMDRNVFESLFINISFFGNMGIIPQKPADQL